MVPFPELAAIRLGYGLSAHQSSPASPDQVLASVTEAGPDSDALTTAEAAALRLKHGEQVRRADAGEGQGDRNRYRDEAMRRAERAQRTRLARAAGAPAGFGERLVQFWSDHFTVQGGNPFQTVMAMALVDDAIRPHLGGRFADMMFAAETHPRMLSYLNQDRSFGPNSRVARNKTERHLGLNENLAREMIELHSLGVGADYSQTDVRQLAMLLTGLTYDARTGGRFRPGMAEPGAETVLGRRYGGAEAGMGDIRAVIEDLARHPATAAHLARKIAVHFVADDPPQALVDRLAGIYLESDGDLSALYRDLVEAPELGTHFRQKLRQPFDFVVAALRGLGLGHDEIMAMPDRVVQARLIRPLAGMGQRWGMPRGPDGWPEDATAWATPQGLAARIDWAMRQAPRLLAETPDPRAFLEASLGATASEPLRWAVPKAESAGEGLAIVLASADFNRR
ncbi:DUF1800 domain-containing protein [Paracoccus spongiarum]|uniref:DUF1800 domain-containing protein n=1 Tax=Paracoccus spongiarum TaxID=3064387 RepID=A0ABT9JDA6_9RHOB|nr:DUF1800 domain-containing protein [Paracoccus sp. 2205BS29-5]MDP5307700.1 DUF1800 domain-containing protein [Paracoccus sp. 2205BS29-5]